MFFAYVCVECDVIVSMLWNACVNLGVALIQDSFVLIKILIIIYFHLIITL